MKKKLGLFHRVAVFTESFLLGHVLYSVKQISLHVQSSDVTIYRNINSLGVYKLNFVNATTDFKIRKIVRLKLNGAVYDVLKLVS